MLTGSTKSTISGALVKINGSSEQPSIAVQAATFEQAKCDMELALAQHLELLLSGEKQAKGHAA
jgi:hypothetical protein